MNKLSIEEFLDKNNSLTYTFSGVSMLPLLRQKKDLYTIVKKSKNRCKKYDVVLYRRYPDKYVLHRVIKVREKDYVILGDNCLNKEYGITDNDIVAVMTEYIKKGKVHSVNEKRYRIYSILWYKIYPIRKIYKLSKGILCKILKHK